MLEWCIVLMLALSAAPTDETVLFEDDFRVGLKEGWSWVREHREAWRTTAEGLEILVEPGNLWGKENSAKNVLIRPVPVSGGGVAASVRVENKPSYLYEQVNLVWYYDDSNMVKIGLELVHEQLSLVMGREEKDQTQTLAIIPLAETVVELRLAVQGDRIRGAYRVKAQGEWQHAGACDLPKSEKPSHFSIQAYRGPEDAEHWAKISQFKVWQTKITGTGG